MKKRFRLICRRGRGERFYCVDTQTGTRTSLKTSNADEAEQIVLAKNQALRQPELNLRIAQAYLVASDPGMTKRTWADVMREYVQTKGPKSRARYERATQEAAFALIRDCALLDNRD